MQQILWVHVIYFPKTTAKGARQRQLARQQLVVLKYSGLIEVSASQNKWLQ